jgi:hypothetical protein
MSKSRRMRWAGQVARWERRKVGYLWESQKVRDHWKDQNVGGWTILKWIFDSMGWIGLIWLRIGSSGRLL